MEQDKREHISTVYISMILSCQYLVTKEGRIPVSIVGVMTQPSHGCKFVFSSKDT